MTLPTANAPQTPPRSDLPTHPGPRTFLFPVWSRQPSKPTGRKSWRVLVAGVIALFVVTGVGGAVMLVGNPFTSTQDGLLTHEVRRERLDLTIVERGTLESAENSDILCRVRAGSKGSTVSTTIKWIIDDGSHVTRGQKLVELDDSGLIEQLKLQKITLDSAKALMVQAEENYNITVSQNESDIQTAKIAIELARLDLDKYLHGEYQQTRKDIEGRIAIAESDLEQWRDRYAWSERMVKKGYLSAGQALAEKSKLQSAEIALARVREELRVLEDFTKVRTEKDLQNKLEEARRAHERVVKQARSKEIQADSERKTRRSIYEQELARLHEIENEVKKCLIVAPQDGLVVYYVPEQSRYGSGSQQSIVAQGEPVREGQKLMRIPNLDKMLVNVKVHEALVSRVREGQPATIRVDAFPHLTLRGQVLNVATVASQTDWSAADVKLYLTQVSIDEACPGLKPGMSAECTITVGHPLDNVLTVPIQAIVGSVELGPNRRCFVLTPNGPVERSVVVGLSNEKMAEIKSGLEVGERVVVNPRALLGDKAKVRSLSHDRPVPPAGDLPGNSGTRDKGPAAPSTEPKRLPADGPRADERDQGKGSRPKLSDEEKQKRQRELAERFRAAPPEERKRMLAELPEHLRDRLKQSLKAQGIDVPE